MATDHMRPPIYIQSPCAMMSMLENAIMRLNVAALQDMTLIQHMKVHRILQCMILCVLLAVYYSNVQS